MKHMNQFSGLRGFIMPQYFLNLPSSEAYDRFHWTFMFQNMEKLGMRNSFVNIIRLLFYDASVSININN